MSKVNNLAVWELVALFLRSAQFTVADLDKAALLLDVTSKLSFKGR